MPEDDRKYLWERAVLVKGDYLIEASSHRYNLLNSNQDPRYYSWKRLLRLPPTSGKDEIEWKDRRSYVKSVFDDPLFDRRDVSGSLENICKAKPDDWRRYIIEKPELIRYCKQGFIRYESPTKILLYRQSQQNHRHREMFSYYLFLSWLEGSPEFPGFEWTHKVVKGGDEESYAETEEWSYGRKHYLLSVRVDDQDGGSTSPQFVIGFRKIRGSVKQPDIAMEIAEILEVLRFKWNDERTCYERGCKTEQKTISILKTVASSLHELHAA